MDKYDVNFKRLALLLLPGGKKTTQKSNAAASAAQTDYAAETERRLTQMLQHKLSIKCIWMIII